MVGINFASLEVAVGVIERSAVGLQRLRSENGVVHHALHAVAVARLARYTQQLARQLEMRVGAAGSFKTAVRVGQAGVDVITIGRPKQLVRSPAAGREALCR